MITCDRGGRRLAFAGYKYGTARALPVHLFLLLLLPSPCSVLLRWLRRGGSRPQRRGRLARLSLPLSCPSAAEGALANTLWPPRQLPAAVEMVSSTVTGGQLWPGGALRPLVPLG